MIKKITLSLFLLCYTVNWSNGTLAAQDDESHFSKVFGSTRSYRIFLPADYEESGKRYPVIYYFHGNTGDHKLDIRGVKDLADLHGVIVGAWNGRSVEGDLRPYNIGSHSNIKYAVQFKDYFPELVNYIDSVYRTIPDRSHRGVIGHSMGGFMSFFIAGKYPDLVSAAFSSKGSPEFFVGYPDNHSLYHVRHMFMNHYGLRLGFATSTKCELFYLNNEVISGALREKGLDFKYTTYEGSHDITPEQFRDAFEFVADAFRDPLPDPVRWNHADLYPDFSVWGYKVNSNKTVPGFIEMKGVTKGGMALSTKKWEPDGAAIPGVNISVTTPTLYMPEAVYTFLDYRAGTDSVNTSVLKSDKQGRITFSVDGRDHSLGIFRKGDQADPVLAGFRIDERGKFIPHNRECRIGIRLINRGGSDARKLEVKLGSDNKDVLISTPGISVERIGSGDLLWLPGEFRVTVAGAPPVDGSPFRIRFNLTVDDHRGNTWKDEFDAMVYYDEHEFTNIGIDDGDSEIFGSGNGNNIAEPGETVMIYEITNGSHRLKLYFDDPYIDSERLYDEIQPDKWGDGYSLSSLIHISESCPPGHKIKFLACYDVKDWKLIRRDVTWGTFTITVGGGE